MSTSLPQTPTSFHPQISDPTLFEIITHLIGPWVFMLKALSFLPTTIFALLRLGKLSTLTSIPRLREAWFGTFWAWAGPSIRDNAGPKKIIPLLEGRVRQGKILDDTEHEKQGKRCSGVVLELGPGNGYWVDVFAHMNATTKTPDEKITHVYGVEPSTAAHPSLRSSIRKAGLEEIYDIIPYGIQDLIKPKNSSGSSVIAPESVDCIVTILCLCSIPNPEENVRELYKLLKPGGRWYFYEHVACQRKRAGRGIEWYQRLLGVLWPHFICCQMCRSTGETLLRAASWSEVNLAQPTDEPWCQMLPHVIGVLAK